MVSVQAYGTLESGAPAAARRRSTRAIAALAGLALVAVACLAVVESTRGASKVALEDSPKAAAKETGKEDTGPSTYKSWLGGLTADPASSADAGEQESETANAVLPFSAKIGSLQGTDFAQDVADPVIHTAAPSPWDTVPQKLATLKANVMKETVEYDELKKIVGDGTPNPEAMVVRVAERGPSGPPGPRGPRGAFGLTGPQGPVGPPGPPGDKGRRGPRGGVGPLGLKGFTGDDGKEGYAGKVGKRGPQGAEGANGKKGFPGMPGDVGAPGVQGANGDVGLKGDTGRNGASGPQGAGLLKWILTKEV